MGLGTKSRANWENIDSQHKIDLVAIREYGEDIGYERTGSPPEKPAQTVHQTVQMTRDRTDIQVLTKPETTRLA